MSETTAMVIISVVRTISCVACVGVSGLLATKGMEGWGWFLFGAVVLGSYSFTIK